MLTDRFFAALLDYARREIQLTNYARQRAARGVLYNTDWAMIVEARDENARTLEEAYVRLIPSDRT